MRTAALFAIAVLFASAVRAAAPKPEDWYTPDSYVDEKNTGMFYYNGGEREVKLNAKGQIVIDEDLQKMIGKDYRLKMAIDAIESSLVNTKQIQTLGENLNDLLMLKGLDIAAADGSHFTIKLGNGSQTIKELIKTSSKDGTQVPAKSSQYLADNLTLGWQKFPETVDGRGVLVDKLGLKNSQNPKQDYFDMFSYYGYFIPVVYKGTDDAAYVMHWVYYGGLDASVLGPRAVKIDDMNSVMLSLAGWNNAESNKCSFSMADMLCGLPEDDTEERKAEREYHYVLTRRLKEGEEPELHYVPFGDLLPTGGVGRADEKSITAMGGEDTNTLSLVGWTTAPTADILAELMTVNPANPGDTNIVHHVLARQIDVDDADTNLVYLSLGNLYGVTWATNWTEAVEHVTNTHEIVNWMTNWVYHTQYVTNYEDIVRVTTNAVYHESFITNTWNHENFITNTWNHENFITNTWNHESFVTNVFNHENFITNTWNYESFVTNVFNHESFITNTWNHESFVTNVFNHENFVTNAIEHLQVVENWNVVTNYIVRYLGGASAGGGGSTPEVPAIAPEDDPYSGSYEPEPVDEVLLPVKNARIINAMTNKLFSTVDPYGTLDYASLYTNGEQRAEISGFHLAETNQFPVKVDLGDEIYGIEWVDYPAELIQMTSGNIKQIFQWWQQHSSVTNLLANIITNAEALAELKTNAFARIDAPTMLDGVSVWTNGERKVEIKGFDNAGVCAVPYKHYPTSEDPEGSTTEIRWADVPQGSAGPNFDSTLISNGIEMKWGRAAPAIKFVGTDTNNFAVVGEGANTNTVTFASAADSNVQVHVEEDQNDPGSVTITFGVYYLDNASVTPPVVE